MVKSMTGYGRAVETVNGREFTVELRSVNNRYLDCSVKLPRSLTFAEEADLTDIRPLLELTGNASKDAAQIAAVQNRGYGAYQMTERVISMTEK